jgi:hypothetical protein
VYNYEYIDNYGQQSMTMHLHHPALSLGGKRKGKTKFRNSAEAQKARQLDAEWKELQAKWGVEAEEKKRKRALVAEPLSYSLSAPPGRTTSNGIPSRVTAGGSTASVHKVYTGTKVLGIGTMHKSNAVPIFSDEEAKAISTMRRN